MTKKEAAKSTTSGLQRLAQVSLRSAAWLLRQAARPLAILLYLPVLVLAILSTPLVHIPEAARIKELERRLFRFITQPSRNHAGRTDGVDVGVDIDASLGADDEYVRTQLPKEEEESARFVYAKFARMMREDVRFTRPFGVAGQSAHSEQTRANVSGTASGGLQGPHAPLLAETRKVAALMSQIAAAKKSGVADAVSTVGQQTRAGTDNGALVVSLTNKVLELQKVVQAGDEMPHGQLSTQKAVTHQFLRLLFDLPPNSADFTTVAKKSYRTLALAISSDKLHTEAGPKLTTAQKSYVDDLFRLLNLANEFIEAS